MAASSGRLWSSSTRTWTFFPPMPPEAFRLSTKSSIPFLDEMPKVAVLPVSEPYSPTLISASRFAQPVKRRNTARVKTAGLRILPIRTMGRASVA